MAGTDRGLGKRPSGAPAAGKQRPLGVVVNLARSYPGQSSLTVAMLILRGLLEGLGLAMLLPVIATLVGRSEGGSKIERLLAEAFQAMGIEPTLAMLLVLMVLAVCLKTVISILSTAQISWASARIVADLRLGLIRSVMSARWRYFDNLSTGSLASAVGLESQFAGGCYIPSSRMFAALAQAMAQAGVALLISWQITLVGVVLGAANVFLLSGLVRRSRILGKERKDVTESLTARIVDALGGMKPLKAMGAEHRLAPLLEGDIHGVQKVMRKAKVFGEAVRVMPEPLTAIALAIILYLYVGTGMGEFESLLVLGLLFSRTIQSISQVQQAYQALVSNEAAYWFIEDLTQAAQSDKETVTGDIKPSLTSKISFDKVGFSYGREGFLKDLCFDIPAGKIVSFTGRSGAGKTTIVDMIIGLRQPTSGVITVDGVPLDKIDQRAWRRMIGYVPQETVLFHDTILANVTLGDKTISPARVEECLRDAGAWQFISAMPDGVNTVVGERGGKLSGGQRQRIAVARAIVRKPALLILDEPTSAVDAETEATILETLEKLAGRTTIITISHQDMLKHAADIVFQVEDGVVRSYVNSGADATTAAE